MRASLLAKLKKPYRTQNHTTFTPLTFTLEDGRKVKGAELVKTDKWTWQRSLHAPGCRYVRLQARSRTYGRVLLVVIDKPGDKPFYLISMSLDIQGYTVDPSLESASLDRTDVSHHEAPVSDGGLSSSH